MSGSDLIVAAPWIAFGIGLAAVTVRLLGRQRASRPQSRPPGFPDDPASLDGDGTELPQAGNRAS